MDIVGPSILIGILVAWLGIVGWVKRPSPVEHMLFVMVAGLATGSIGLLLWPGLSDQDFVAVLYIVLFTVGSFAAYRVLRRIDPALPPANQGESSLRTLSVFFAGYVAGSAVSAAFEVDLTERFLILSASWPAAWGIIVLSGTARRLLRHSRP